MLQPVLQGDIKRQWNSDRYQNEFKLCEQECDWFAGSRDCVQSHLHLRFSHERLRKPLSKCFKSREDLVRVNDENRVWLCSPYNCRECSAILRCRCRGSRLGDVNAMSLSKFSFSLMLTCRKETFFLGASAPLWVTDDLDDDRMLDFFSETSNEV